jgi:TRAP-type uncharacterized transport system substrate-binding protein
MAGLFALSAVVALSFHLATAPTILRLAVGPIGSDDLRMAAAFGQALNREKSSIRVKIVLTEGLAQSAALIDDGKAELAIIRPDIKLPVKGETVVITRRFLPFMATNAAKGIERVADLRGKRIGVVSTPAGNI